MLDRRVVPRGGVLGGGDGLPFRITLNPGTPGARDVGGKVSLRLTRGDLVLIETCGGGGFGPPAERPAEAREADRREGRSEEHTSELQSRPHLVCRLLL